jgi:lipopolysaccharide transport system permease protein
MTMWLFFATAMARCTESTVSNVELISKVYFPRLVIPVAALAQPAFDFCVSLAVLVVVMLAFGVLPDAHVLLLPLVFALALALAVGVGLWLSALVVRYRDVKLLIPFLIQTLIFITPVLYPLALIPEKYQALYAINPLVGVMEGFRWALLPGAPSPGAILLVPVASGLLLLVGGLFYFQRAEASFADVI